MCPDGNVFSFINACTLSSAIVTPCAGPKSPVRTPFRRAPVNGLAQWRTVLGGLPARNVCRQAGRRGGSPVLPEQGQSLGSLVCSRASSRRHGAATSSARAWRLGRLILSVGCGYSPAPVATAVGTTTCQAVATANAPARLSQRSTARRSTARRSTARRSTARRSTAQRTRAAVSPAAVRRSRRLT
jgi:hypothetical protein